MRAKRTLAAARMPFEIPRRAELRERLSSVLEVIYLVFNEGYSATAGEHWMRPALCEEALRIGRILAELADRLASQGAWSSYHLLPSVRGELCARLGRYQEARGEFERAATLTQNAREIRLLNDRAHRCQRGEL